MQHIKVTIAVTDESIREMLIAMLSDAGYTGFEETENELLAYIADNEFGADELKDISGTFGLAYAVETIAQQNWNALWESNFQPVVVDDFCTLRAHFHDIVPVTTYDIVITPKMSFGTGHHATTQLMIMQMKDMQFAGKSVLDFGTGTGVLAILAEMLGAEKILAIDNDEWSVENAIENAERNACEKIAVRQGSLEDIAGVNEDIILANINRHILLQYMAQLYQALNVGGYILMSGLLTEDRAIITAAATGCGFHFKRIQEQANWIAMLFGK